MMSNERRSQGSTPVVVAKDNLKQTEAKGYPSQNKKNKIMSTYLKRLTYTIDGQEWTRSLKLNVLNSPQIALIWGPAGLKHVLG